MEKGTILILIGTLIMSAGWILILIGLHKNEPKSVYPEQGYQVEVKHNFEIGTILNAVVTSEDKVLLFK